MNSEQIKEEFLKSYNCSSMKEFKHTKLTSEKFYEIMEDYFTKCLYNEKYKEVIDKAIEWIKKKINSCTIEAESTTKDTMCRITISGLYNLLNILEEVE